MFWGETKVGRALEFHLRGVEWRTQIGSWILWGKPKIFIWVLGADLELSCGFWRWTWDFHMSFKGGPKSDGSDCPHNHICGYAPNARNQASEGNPHGPMWLLFKVEEDFRL